MITRDILKYRLQTSAHPAGAAILTMTLVKAASHGRSSHFLSNSDKLPNPRTHSEAEVPESMHSQIHCSERSRVDNISGEWSHFTNSSLAGALRTTDSGSRSIAQAGSLKKCPLFKGRVK